MSVARVITPAGSTPNRARVYRVLNKHNVQRKSVQAEYPMSWEPRVVESFDGEYIVYDVVATLDRFGPDDVTGAFRFTYSEGRLEEVLTGEVPYPNTVPYPKMLADWLAAHPYPGVV
jgi:hypothetical protein